MSRILFAVLILTFFNSSCFSQNDNVNANKYFGANISYLTESDFYFQDGHLFSTNVTYRHNRHYIHIGPLWFYNKTKNSELFRGANLSYEFFPFKANKILNFYFIYDFIFCI